MDLHAIPRLQNSTLVQLWHNASHFFSSSIELSFYCFLIIFPTSPVGIQLWPPPRKKKEKETKGNPLLLLTSLIWNIHFRMIFFNTAPHKLRFEEINWNRIFLIKHADGWNRPPMVLNSMQTICRVTVKLWHFIALMAFQFFTPTGAVWFCCDV